MLDALRKAVAAHRLRRRLREGGGRLSPFIYAPRDLKPQWVLDIGANEGDTARAALESFPGCRVICVEPVAAQFATLQQRLAAYGDRCVFHHCALSDQAGEREIRLTSYHRANSLDAPSPLYRQFNPSIEVTGSEKIRCVRLDDLAAELPTPRVDILKIDVEGHELQVLRGGRQFISTCVDTIMLEISLQRDSGLERQSFLDLFNLLHEYGFRLINLYDLYNARWTDVREGTDLMTTQMDGVFRHVSKLHRSPA